jgi:hypothetical protein
MLDALYHVSSVLLPCPLEQTQVPWRDAQTSGTASRSSAALYPFCLLPLCLPRFCLGWRRICSSKFFVGEPLASDGVGYFDEPLSIGGLAGIEPETFFVQVPKEVERFNVDIGSCDSALQETPEVFNTIGVYLAPDILFRMVNHFMNEVPVKSSIAAMGISVDSGTRFNVATDTWREGLPLGVWYYLSLNSAMFINSMPVEESHYYGFANSASTLNLGFPLALVHVPGFATDERFVNLNLSRHLVERLGLHRQADTVEHEPCGFLSDTDGAMDFVGANAVLGIGNHPDSSQPLIQSNRAILKDGSHLDGELPLSVFLFALPKTASRDEPDINTAASGAGYSIRPAEFDHEVKADIRVREVLDSFNKSSWLAHVSTSFHCPKCIIKELLSQVYYCLSNHWC